MSYAAWIAPAIVSVLVVIQSKFQWLPAALVFFVGPFLATLITLVGPSFVEGIAVPSVRDATWLCITYFLFVFPYAFYPHGVLIGSAIILSCAALRDLLERWPSRTLGRLVAGMLVGGGIGVAFGLLVVLVVMLSHQNTRLIELVSGGTLDRLRFGDEILLSACIGAVDGSLIAVFGRWKTSRESITKAPGSWSASPL